MKEADKAKEERKKQMTGVMTLVALPVWLNMIDKAYSDVYRLVLKYWLHIPVEPLRRDFEAGSGLCLGAMFLVCYLWIRPAYLYIGAPSPELLGKIRRRISNVYRDAGFLFLIMAVLRLLLALLMGGSLSGGFLAGLALSIFAQASVTPIFIDWYFTHDMRVMEILYTREELHRIRAGFSLPLYVKISLLVAGSAVLPFVLIDLCVLFGAPPAELSGPLLSMLFTALVSLVVGLGTIFRGLQQPLRGLIAKMEKVAAGEYVQTRIYFSDEVAQLKAGFNQMVDGLKEREELRDTFGKYMSIEIARELIKNKNVNLGGEDVEAAVMFCDIRNFTPLSETMSATRLVEFLNDYFHYITPPITVHHGVINKFMGDAVMAIFTPGLGSSDYAADAVRAALDMRAALGRYNAGGKAPVKVEFGIGIHTGRLVAGNIGTASRLEYTFIGDTVNIASRLESKTKDLGTDILLSSETVAGASGSLGQLAAFSSVGQVPLKGKKAALELYKVL